MSEVRKSGESFKQYRLRLKTEAKALKRKLHGRMIWVSCPPLGYEGEDKPKYKRKGIGRTYIRAQHGEIGSR